MEVIGCIGRRIEKPGRRRKRRWFVGVPNRWGQAIALSSRRGKKVDAMTFADKVYNLKVL